MGEDTESNYDYRQAAFSSRQDDRKRREYVNVVHGGDFDDPYNRSELSALIDLGIVTYRMWDTPTSLFYRYRSPLNENLLKAVLNSSGIKSSGAPDVDDFIDKFILGEENTAKLLRTEWDIDKISASTALGVTAGAAFDSVVTDLFDWVSKIKDAKLQEKLLISTFRFTTNNGRHVVKFPECEIPDRLRSKIDYSHLTTSTYAGTGRAYTIDFERVRDSEGNSISTKSSSWKKLDGLKVTVDRAMPRWKKVYWT